MTIVTQLPEQFIESAQFRTDTLQVLTAAFLGVAWFAVLLRLWIRGYLIRSLGYDDWAMLATNILFTGYCASVFLLNSYNPKLMLGALPINQYTMVFRYLIASMALYVATTVAFKIALGLFFLRIMVDKWQRQVIYATVGFSTLYGSVYFFFAIFQCGNPVHFIENQILGNCVKSEVLLPFNLTAGIINALSDWILGLLPVFLLRKAQMPMLAKISAGCLMLLGTAGSISSVVRLKYVHDYLPGEDFFWTSISLTTWSIIECGVCIITASLATVRPLFKYMMDNVRTLTPAYGRGNHSNPFASKSRTQDSNTSGNGTWRSGRSHTARDSFVPLSDVSGRDESGWPVESKYANGQTHEIGHVSAPGNRSYMDVLREENGKQAKRLELARIALRMPLRSSQIPEEPAAYHRTNSAGPERDVYESHGWSNTPTRL
ncbi:hypothetical protein LTR17_003884 [Elasticomyces elasticus]|nr:hypothetical protein LTR17_003884 [Elasticomyces elasticus]